MKQTASIFLSLTIFVGIVFASGPPKPGATAPKGPASHEPAAMKVASPLAVFSDIVAVASSEAASISSLENSAGPLTAATGTQVWSIRIRDGGAPASDGDVLPTIVTSFKLTKGGSNQVTNWFNAVRAAVLLDGSTVPAQGSVSADSIFFNSFTASAPDNSTKDLTIRISLKTSGLTDGQHFHFALLSTNTTIQSGGTSSPIGAFSPSSNASQNSIDVTATELDFTTDPQTGKSVGENMAPVVVKAVDANGNTDLQYSDPITLVSSAFSLISTDPLDSDSLTHYAASGVATWANLSSENAATGVIFATDGFNLDDTSGSITVNTPPTRFRSASTGNWNNTSTWEQSTNGGATWSAAASTPDSSNGAITIRNSHTVTITAGVVVDQVTVDSGSTLATSVTVTNGGTLSVNGTFQIEQGGWATGNNFTYGTPGTLNFNNSSGTYEISSGDVYWPASNGPVNVNVNGAGGISLGANRTVQGAFTTVSGIGGAGSLTFNGFFEIRNGGYISTTPSYGTGATLVYNSGGDYGRYNEWNSTSGPGYPYHVQISGNTSLNISGGAETTPKALAGDLTIDNGSTFTMDFTGDEMEATVTVLGDLVNNGSLRFSSAEGGDMIVGGSWYNNADVYLTNRTVTLNGSAPHITFSFFSYLILSSSSAVVLDGDVYVVNDLTVNSGGVNLGTHGLWVAGNATNNATISGTGLFTIAESVPGTSWKGGELTRRTPEQGAASKRSSKRSDVTAKLNGNGTYGNVRDWCTSNIEVNGSMVINGELSFPGGNGILLVDANIVLNGTVDLQYGGFIETNGTGVVSRPMSGGATFSFPITPGPVSGNSVTIHKGANDGLDTVELRTAYGQEVAVPDEEHVVDYTWVVKTKHPGNDTLDITLTWPSGEEGTSFNPAGASLWHFNGSSWTETGNSVDASATDPRSAPWYGQTVSGYFVVGTDAALPVEVSSFSATAHNSSASISWSTATEIHTVRFEVERKTVSGSNAPGWKAIATVAAAGTSTAPKKYSATDAELSGGTFAYRLKVINADGSSSYFGSAEVTIIVPKEFGLSEAYPNPFNPTTNFTFTLPEEGHVSLKVYSMIGQEVGTLVNEDLKAGEYHQAIFNATGLATGPYFARLEFGGKILMKKLVLMK